MKASGGGSGSKDWERRIRTAEEGIVKSMAFLDHRFQQLHWEQLLQCDYINFSMELMYRKQMEWLGIDKDELKEEVTFMMQAKPEFQLAMGEGSKEPKAEEESKAKTESKEGTEAEELV